LLRNMLPEPIAGRLKQREEVIADAFGEVTVLFADIVDFTEHAERTPPEATVALLNELFSQFDGLTEARGLEKIKTVGDAYMVAGGLPDPMPDHAGAAAEVALEMLNVADRCSLPDGGPVRLRIGIASGPVVAGVYRQAEVQLRPVGRHGQHRQSDGDHRSSRMRPGHRADP
jgi:class 3 adenylate cyclase